jgi:hypothetical protein
MGISNLNLYSEVLNNTPAVKKRALPSIDRVSIQAKIHYFVDCELVCEARFEDCLLDLLLYSEKTDDVQALLLPLSELPTPNQ